MLAGVVILVSAGFWRVDDPAMTRALRSMNGGPGTEPPSPWHILKWSAIGAFVFLFSLSVLNHPSEISKQITRSDTEDRSD